MEERHDSGQFTPQGRQIGGDRCGAAAVVAVVGIVVFTGNYLCGIGTTARGGIS